MTSTAELALFAAVAARPEEEIDLARAALLIAEPEYPGLDVARYVGEIDAIADAIAGAGRPDLGRVLGHLYGELGFHGNATDYYDPRNSFLNEVIDRRTGIPITLAVLLLEVCNRCSLPSSPVAFPGHFLVRAGGAIVDPFAGRVLDERGLAALHARATGGSGPPDPKLLEPCTKAQLLARMLGNLRQIYASLGDRARLAGVLDRLELLSATQKPAPRRAPN